MNVVLYHGPDCPDGFASAWVARRFLPPGAVFLPVQYGQEPPAMEVGSRVYVLDFCYPLATLERLADSADILVVLDHHVSREADLRTLERQDRDNVRTVFHLEKSGARLAWEWFAPPRQPSPWLVDYVEDRDLWKWNLPDSREVSACIASHPFYFDLWDFWAGMHAPDARAMFFAEGSAILRYQAQVIERAVRNAVETDIAGHRVLAVNATNLISEIAGKLAEGRPFGATWFQRADGKRVYSLRSAPDGLDVSKIAQERGGGGHRHASGFTQ